MLFVLRPLSVAGSVPLRCVTARGSHVGSSDQEEVVTRELTAADTANI